MMWVDPQAGVGLSLEGLHLDEALTPGSPGPLFRATSRERTHVIVRFLGIGRPRLDVESIDRLQTVRHPNLAAYEASGTVGAGPFRGNRWLARKDLPQRLNSSLGPVEPDGREGVTEQLAQQLMIELVSGLEHLHGHGLVHGDLKPSNIAVHHGHYQLLDFGILPSFNDLTLREARARAFFVAPEVPELGSSRSSDVYGWAATVLALLAGQSDVRPSSPLDVANDLSIVGHPALGILRSCLSLEPEARPQLTAVRAFLTHDQTLLNELFEATLRDVAASSRFRTSLRSVSAGAQMDSEDFEQTVIERTLRRARVDSELMVRLSSGSAMQRYLIAGARNLGVDLARQHRTRPVVLSPALELVAADEALDPFARADESMSALSAVEAEIGGRSARLLWRRAYGHSYSAIADEFEWTEHRVFMTAYRLKRAYPELASLVPPDDVDYSENQFVVWLREIGVDEARTRMVASVLAGRPLAEIADREGISPSGVQKRLNRMAKDSRVVALALAGHTLDPARLRRIAPYLSGPGGLSYTDPLGQPWQQSVRDHAAVLMDAVLNDEWEEGEHPMTAAEAIDAVIDDVDAALESQRMLLDQPMTVVEPESLVAPLLLQGRDSMIVLDVEGKTMVPSFQLSSETAELHAAPLVARINRVLEADVDPVGALAWWSQGNGRIGGRKPKDLLGVEDDVLTALGDALLDDAA